MMRLFKKNGFKVLDKRTKKLLSGHLFYKLFIIFKLFCIKLKRANFGIQLNIFIYFLRNCDSDVIDVTVQLEINIKFKIEIGVKLETQVKDSRDNLQLFASKDCNDNRLISFFT